MGMNNLTHLHIVSKHDNSNYGQLKIQVSELILSRRLNFIK